MRTDPAFALTAEQLVSLVETVFAPGPDERRLGILVDLPDAEVPDSPPWRARREMAAGWAAALATAPGLECALLCFRNARMSNADLPSHAWPHQGPLPPTVDDLPRDGALPFEQIFADYPLLLAPTEFSATAPLKLAARRHGFRAATMPGFSPEMIPALRLDYAEVDRRVRLLQARLDRASAATLELVVDGTVAHRLRLDLRHRQAHASGGLLHRPGTAGNLPSGEAYIVPYEGELPGQPSQSRGSLPVQFGQNVVSYRFEHNRAVAVEGDATAAAAERARLAAEPAYGNIAELGLGVLADFGIAPVGQVLLDEKLGLHVAFGRSDHFGGQVGASDFSRPEAVIHIDRVYLPSLQPRIAVRRVVLEYDNAPPSPLIVDGSYVDCW